MLLILFEIFMLVLGFVLLIRASDLFVDSISSIASNFRVPSMIIALTVAAFATCAPELAISFNSLASSLGDIAVSNVLGSCIVNILLIIGVSSFLYPIKVSQKVVKNEAFLLLCTTLVFTISMLVNLVFAKNNVLLTRTNAVIFLLMFGLFIYYIITLIKKSNIFSDRDKPKYKLLPSILLSLFCIVSIIIASDIIVEFASVLAVSMNISRKIITMTVIVIGTSLPELTMTVISAKKKEYDIAIGNIIGTNIFNIGIVLGLPILVYGSVVSNSFNVVDIFVVFTAALLFYLFAKNDRVLTRREGFVMILVFVVYYLYMFLV